MGGSGIFESNLSDAASLEKSINALSIFALSADSKPTVVLDTGTASEENLKMPRKRGFHYLCVARSGMNKYTVNKTVAPKLLPIIKVKPSHYKVYKWQTAPTSRHGYIVWQSKPKKADEPTVCQGF